jgi:hypothetical protein
MRNYSLENYPSNVEINFKFLINEYGFDIIEKKEREFSYLFVFERGDIKVILNYDYMDNFFYFSIINGKNKHYKDEDSENSLTFYDLAKFKDSEFKLEDIQPNDEQYLTSLKNNATILKKYGHDILIGEEWI